MFIYFANKNLSNLSFYLKTKNNSFHLNQIKFKSTTKKLYNTQFKKIN